MKRIEKPEKGEYAPYAIQYSGLLPDDGLILEHLKHNLKITRDFLLSLPEERLTYRYAEGKWTIKEILLVAVQVWRVAAILKALVEADARNFATAEEVAALHTHYQS